MLSLVRTEDPAVEPITLDQAKKHCRVDHDEDDDYIESLIVAARIHAEKYTNRAFILQTWRLSLDRFPGYQPWNLGSPFAPVVGRQFATDFICGRYMQPPLEIPRPRLIAVTSIQYYDINNEQQTLDPGAYIVNADGEPATIFPIPFTWWPAAMWGRPDAVQVTFTAGYGGKAENVPQNVQLAMLGLIAHWYENREAAVLTNSTNAVTTIPEFVNSLLDDEIAPAFTFTD